VVVVFTALIGRRRTIAWPAVAAPPPPLRRTARERLAAWLVTGPLGHLWSVVADISSFAARSAATRAARRLRRAGHSPRR
jgi:hypothetical protein